VPLDLFHKYLFWEIVLLHQLVFVNFGVHASVKTVNRRLNNQCLRRSDI